MGNNGVEASDSVVKEVVGRLTFSLPAVLVNIVLGTRDAHRLGWRLSLFWSICQFLN